MMEMDDLSPELQKLKMKLARFLVAENKSKVVKYLQRKRNLLMSLPLADIGLEVTLEQANKDAAREKIAFNNQHYKGGWDELHRLRADLLEHTTELMSSPECTTAVSAEALANLVLIKASRTRNGGDAYVKTRMLFEPEGGDWVLKPLDRDTYPIDIKLMLHSRAIFTQISTMNQYGLYRMEDLMEGDSAVPWLPVDALVVEQIDLNNDRTFRDLRILSALDGPVRRKLVDRLFFRKRKKLPFLSSSAPAYEMVAPAHASPPTQRAQAVGQAAPSPDRKDLMGSRRYEPPKPALPEVPEEEGVAEDDPVETRVNVPSEVDRGEISGGEEEGGLSLVHRASRFGYLEGNMFNPFSDTSDSVNTINSWFEKPSFLDDKSSWFDAPPTWFDSDERAAEVDSARESESRSNHDDDDVSVLSEATSESSFLDFDWPIMTDTPDNWFRGIFDKKQEDESSSDDDESEAVGDTKEIVEEKEVIDISADSPVPEGVLDEDELVDNGHSMSMHEELEEESEDELGDLLSLIGLSHFHLPLTGVGITDIASLKSASDEVLISSGMKKVHLLKLKRAVEVLSTKSGRDLELPLEVESPRLFGGSKSEVGPCSSRERSTSSGGSGDTATLRPLSNPTHHSFSSPSPSPSLLTGRQRAATMTPDNNPLPVFPQFIPPEINLPDSAQHLLAHHPPGPRCPSTDKPPTNRKSIPRQGPLTPVY